MSGPIKERETHVVRVELKGPKSREGLREFHDALKQLVESSGGKVRILRREKGGRRARPVKRRKAARRSRRAG